MSRNRDNVEKLRDVASVPYVDNLFAQLQGSTVYGLIYNQTDDTYKRFGTATAEDNVWLSSLAGRLNTNSNSDSVTAFFNQTKTVQGNMKRVVVNNSGNYVRDYNANTWAHSEQIALSATETVMVRIPKFYYINVDFVYNTKTYTIIAQSLEEFSLDLETLGFVGASGIVGQNTGYSSYSAIVGTTISSIVHSAFDHYSAGIKNVMYMGAFDSYNIGGIYSSRPTLVGTSTQIKATGTITIANARAGHLAFGSSFNTVNYLQREALAITILIEKGTHLDEVNGQTQNTKWEGYSWNTAAASDDVNLGQTLPLLNSTGVIKDSSNRIVANSYRGLEDYHSHLWNFIDGCNIISGQVYIAKHGSTYLSDISTTPYLSTGRTTLTTGSGAYISSMYPGTIIPSNTGGTSLTKMTVGGWFASGNVVLMVGGSLTNPGLSGVVRWGSSNVSSYAIWTIVSRFSALADL